MKYLIILLFTSFVFLAVGCIDDDDLMFDPCAGDYSVNNVNCPDYDPCLGIVAANSDFQLYVSPYFGAPISDTILKIVLEETDTISSGGDIFFQALEEADSYLWTMSGTSQTWDQRSFRLNFPASVNNSTIEVTLTTRVAPSTCISASDTVSSSTQGLNFTDSVFDSPYRGNYQGSFCNSNESLDTIGIVEGFIVFDNYIVGLPGECQIELIDPRIVQIGIIDRKFFLVSDEHRGSSNNICGRPIGTGEFSEDGQFIEFTYRYTFQDGSHEQRCWSGLRID